MGGAAGGKIADRGQRSGESPYKAGERVRHAKFGVGDVVEAEPGRLVVRFGAEEKVLVPEIAPLSRA